MRTIAVDMDGVLADALALFLELDAEKILVLLFRRVAASIS